MERPYSILLADAHVGFRREVRKILEEIPNVKVTGEAGNRHELFELLRQSPPSLVILDVSMPDLRAGEGTRLIKLHYPEVKVLIMVMDQEPEYLNYGLATGAAGVLPKQYVAEKCLGPLPPSARGEFICHPGFRGKILAEGTRRRAAGADQAGWGN